MGELVRGSKSLILFTLALPARSPGRGHGPELRHDPGENYRGENDPGEIARGATGLPVQTGPPADPVLTAPTADNIMGRETWAVRVSAPRPPRFPGNLPANARITDRPLPAAPYRPPLTGRPWPTVPCRALVPQGAWIAG